jgi:hypothetical protein
VTKQTFFRAFRGLGARELCDARRHDRERLGGAAADARSARDRKRETRVLEYHPARFSRSAGAEAASIAGDETFERRLAQSDVCIETPSP